MPEYVYSKQEVDQMMQGVYDRLAALEAIADQEEPGGPSEPTEPPTTPTPTPEPEEPPQQPDEGSGTIYGVRHDKDSLATHSGLYVAMKGEVISGVFIKGTLDLRQSVGAEVEDVYVEGEILCNSGCEARIEYTTINGMGQRKNGLSSGGYFAQHLDVFGSGDGVRCNSRSTLQYSRVHDLVRAPGGHHDCAQTTMGSDITLRHNRLEAWTNGDFMNAAYLVNVKSSPVRNLDFSYNYCDGGNFSVQILGPENVTVVGNRFSRRARYGAMRLDALKGSTIVDDNRYVDGVLV